MAAPIGTGRHKGITLKFHILKHKRVPEEERGALWWLIERELAERDVTLADIIIESSRDDFMRYRGRKLLDVRLDYLERVEDTCDAILCELSKVDPDMADVAKRHYLKHEDMTAIANERGVPMTALRTRMYNVLGRFRPAIRTASA